MMYCEFLDRVDLYAVEKTITEAVYHKYIEPIYNYCTHSKEGFCELWRNAYRREFIEPMRTICDRLPNTAENITAFQVVREAVERRFLDDFLAFPMKYGIVME